MVEHYENVTIVPRVGDVVIYREWSESLVVAIGHITPKDADERKQGIHYDSEPSIGICNFTMIGRPEGIVWVRNQLAKFVRRQQVVARPARTAAITRPTRGLPIAVQPPVPLNIVTRPARTR